MRIAFYAPLKPPSHAIPSGDRRVGRLLLDALRLAGHDVEVASEFRSFCASPEGDAQAGIRAAGEKEAGRLLARFRSGAAPAPDVWFTYHVYYKAPDWLGPRLSRALGIPYVIAEASHAPKRAQGPWAPGHDAARDAICAADAIVSLTRPDMEMVAPLAASPERLVYLPPFLDGAPFAAARENAAAHRSAIAGTFGLDADASWILSVAMMREGPKLESYELLGQTLSRVEAVPWQLLVVGDGGARTQVRAALESAAPDRIFFAGTQPPDALPGFYAASDLYVWPAVHEAYGMALLEAQAAGLPVVAGRVRGVPDVVEDGLGGLLAPEGDVPGLAARVDRILKDEHLRERLGEQAHDFVRDKRTVEQAARILTQTLDQALSRSGAEPADTARQAAP